jgi:hypothetical protein
MRMMPKKMQIYNFKRFFLLWNKKLEKENPHFAASDQIDLIDWESFVVEGQTFEENRCDLKNNYPEYFWSRADATVMENKLKEFEDEQIHASKVQVEESREQHEALYEAEQHQEVPVLEEVEEPETPAGEWKIEQSEGVEIHTIELEVLPHRTNSKGKTYEYGRIQLIVDKNLVGCPVKISIKVLKI